METKDFPLYKKVVAKVAQGILILIAVIIGLLALLLLVGLALNAFWIFLGVVVVLGLLAILFIGLDWSEEWKKRGGKNN